MELCLSLNTQHPEETLKINGNKSPRTGFLDPVEITSQKRQEELWKLEGVTAGKPTPSASSPGEESAVSLSKSSHVQRHV